ncbi:hypothetical protein, partial [Streptomyces sp. Agncl-13]|uniref:hypothetical protein n=1 Tax=Streptomyces sp. Agncl-13 TaxID=3400628 RepID=UPI003A865676
GGHSAGAALVAAVALAARDRQGPHIRTNVGAMAHVMGLMTAGCRVALVGPRARVRSAPARSRPSSWRARSVCRLAPVGRALRGVERDCRHVDLASAS